MAMDTVEERKLDSCGPSVLMDLRPCYEGFAGIPQEARLLFALFAQIRLTRLGGLASGIHYVTKRRQRTRDDSPFSRVLQQTRTLIAQDTKRHFIPPLSLLLPGRLRRYASRAYVVAAYAGRSEALDLEIDPDLFEDFLWTKLFENTLSPADRYLLRRAKYFPTELGHENARHLSFLPPAFQRRINTAGWDLFFACTVSPYRVRPGTKMVVRYYDPLPLLSPHTVGEPWPHANSHARMLQRNIAHGATFICASDPVRDDILRMFPEAATRVQTIPCLIAPDYWPDVRSLSELKQIVQRRASASSAPGHRGGQSETTLPRLIMVVSTLEPRKNYLRLFRAFEIARLCATRSIQLLVVANPGWRSDAELAHLKRLVSDGAYHLSAVPTAELRLLYSMAHLVVAPSRAEGFDYSGVESMACGTPVIASDTNVHRWVYGDAAEYVDAYDEEALGRTIARLADLPRDEGWLAELRQRGISRARLYQSGTLLPRWEETLHKLVNRDGTKPQVRLVDGPHPVAEGSYRRPSESDSAVRPVSRDRAVSSTPATGRYPHGHTSPASTSSVD